MATLPGLTPAYVQSLDLMSGFRFLIPVLLSVAGGAFAQSLVCPPSSTAATKSCELFHFHVQRFRPDTKQLVELSGLDQFASQSACERERDVQLHRNLAVVEFIRKTQNDSSYEPDRFGPCHCDATVDRGNTSYLTDLQRQGQLRTSAEINMRVRARLLDAGVASDSELVRGLVAAPQPPAVLGGARLVALPSRTSNANPQFSPDELKSTHAADGVKSAAATIDLPLVDVLTGAPAVVAAEAPSPEPETAPIPAPVATASSAVPVPAPSANVATPPRPEPAQPGATPSIQVTQSEGRTVITNVVAGPRSEAPPTATPSSANPDSSAEPVTGSTPTIRPGGTVAAPATNQNAAVEVTAEPPAEDAAESFIGYETERIQNVLKASSAIGDETVKAKIFEACIQRIQLLSNLRALIEGSGMHSRLANAARAAKTEQERVTFVSRLFGSDIAPHWAPHDATDVVLATTSNEASADQVLRDPTGHYSVAQRKRALYDLLARSQPTEEQQLSLQNVIEGFLQ